VLVEKTGGRREREAFGLLAARASREGVGSFVPEIR
jgi:hypothetical protein